MHAAQALANWAASRHGTRTGKSVGFPRFKSRHKTTPAFRLRAKYTEGVAPPVRPTGAKSMRFPKLGQLRVRESTRRLRRLLESGRFLAYAAAFRFERGRWVVSVTGVAAPFHPARRTTTCRHQARVGVDLGVKTLAVAADEHGTLRGTWEGVKALHSPDTPEAGQPEVLENQEGLQGPARRQHDAWAGSTPASPRCGRRCCTRSPPTSPRAPPASWSKQDCLVRHRPRHRRPLVPLVEDLLRLRHHQGRPDLGRPDLPMRLLRPGHRPRRQRRDQPGPLRSLRRHVRRPPELPSFSVRAALQVGSGTGLTSRLISGCTSRIEVAADPGQLESLMEWELRSRGPGATTATR